MPQIEVQFCT